MIRGVDYQRFIKEYFTKKISPLHPKPQEPVTFYINSKFQPRLYNILVNNLIKNGAIKSIPYIDKTVFYGNYKITETFYQSNLKGGIRLRDKKLIINLEIYLPSVNSISNEYFKHLNLGLYAKTGLGNWVYEQYIKYQPNIFKSITLNSEIMDLHGETYTFRKKESFLVNKGHIRDFRRKALDKAKELLLNDFKKRYKDIEKIFKLPPNAPKGLKISLTKQKQKVIKEILDYINNFSRSVERYGYYKDI
jgi:hypothetical protein